MDTDLVRAPGGWTAGELDIYVDYLSARGHAVGNIRAFGRVRGPAERDPPHDYELRIESIQGGQVVLGGGAYETGDYVWLDLRESPHRAVVLKVIHVARDAVVLAPMRRLLWERAAPAPF
jgi:hypothetical protein